MQTGSLPLPVINRSKAVRSAGQAWLAALDSLVCGLKARRGISVGETLTGGPRSYTAYATGQDGRQYVLKIIIPGNVWHL